MKTTFEKLHFTTELNLNNFQYFIIYGPDKYLKIRSNDLITKYFVAKNYTRQVFDLANKDLTELPCGDLFNPNVLLQINLEQKLTTKLQARLLDLTKLSPEIKVLLNFDNLTTASEKTKWFTTLSQKGLSLAHWTLTGNNYLRYIQHQAKNLDVKLDNSATSLLYDLTEQNPLASTKILENLSLLNIQATLSAKHLAKILNEQSSYNVFQLIAAILSNNQAKISKIINNLACDNNNIQLTIWGLKEIVNILANPNYPNKLGKKLGQQAIEFSTKLLANKPSSNFNISELFQKLADFDILAKTFKSKLNIWLQIENYCLQLASLKF